jgi:hypothetical protein
VGPLSTGTSQNIRTNAVSNTISYLEELAPLMHNLKVLFEHTQNMVDELKEYRLQVQAVQNGI